MVQLFYPTAELSTAGLTTSYVNVLIIFVSMAVSFLIKNIQTHNIRFTRIQVLKRFSS